jgi:hypothetical protein
LEAQPAFLGGTGVGSQRRGVWILDPLPNFRSQSFAATVAELD